MIPLAICIGIIEDKIANDLTSKDTKARECLEDVKAKIKNYKPKKEKQRYKIRVYFNKSSYGNTCKIDRQIDNVIDLDFGSDFVKIITDKCEYLYKKEIVDRVEKWESEKCM